MRAKDPLLRIRGFQLGAIAIFLLFFSLMLFVVIITHKKPSGNTHQDTTKLQQTRLTAQLGKDL